MPKMKTHSSLKGRFKITGTGKVKRYKAYKTTCFPTNPSVRSAYCPIALSWRLEMLNV